MAISKIYLATGEEKALELAKLPIEPTIRIVCGEAKREIPPVDGLVSGGRGAYRYIEELGYRSIKGKLIDGQNTKKEVEISSRNYPIICDAGTEYKFDSSNPLPAIFFYGKCGDKNYVEFEARHGVDSVKRTNFAVGGFLLEELVNEAALQSPEETLKLFSEAFAQEPEQLEHHKDAITAKPRVVARFDIRDLYGRF